MIAGRGSEIKRKKLTGRVERSNRQTDGNMKKVFPRVDKDAYHHTI